MTQKTKTTPVFAPGDWAQCIQPALDPREVVRVTSDSEGQWLKLAIGVLVTDWLPAELYERIPAADMLAHDHDDEMFGPQDGDLATQREVTKAGITARAATRKASAEMGRVARALRVRR